VRKKSKRPKFKNPYKTENELCNVLIDYARLNGWKVYPETSGFDILLVKDIQMGIQAKLKANIDVLAQVVKYDNASPHLKAILVPIASKEFREIANALKIFVIEAATLSWNFNTWKEVWTKEIKISLDSYNKKYLIMPKEECWIPDIEINVAAGIKSPKTITPWKIKAVLLCIKLRQFGFITSKDFKDEGLSMTIWKRKKWIIDSGSKNGNLIKYIVNTKVELPDQKYPEIVLAIQNSK
jgi:hypothetical protein